MVKSEHPSPARARIRDVNQAGVPADGYSGSCILESCAKSSSRASSGDTEVQ